MQQVTFYHNPRCSKSRESLKMVEDLGITPEIIHYLDTPPTAEELALLLKQLGFNDARQLMRTKEDLYKELNLADKALSQETLLKAMAENPKLIERPIVVAGNQARLGRPPEQVKEILG
ncbi:arsenate reductase (glutaredoxin) [Xenorhabdus nematophila]|uniref:Arsenate reductase n=1 Tax=Xenorhabdus nematophila (strain ATCC 19061 / DSM 3370 / CCUG 14189 / LMG 1036 / NCIMB 9965 / AN6) TaxID=406817 RepID=D3VI83_XENNA|nr:arsenate reductase (glutaredoxin) [Xenorhabdus nematophila]AYA39985.1 arsenate reductase (glutaredoxin) [Xenorhabdus nematophila]KHD28217.1 arsenate reductase [Xenorhabdus nematophila]MBA0018623.1 arsenate reductase (glutaredoxin) [Xenorhabdus nematophila]MCB4425752.1 arsenate reductase (glutaredoxin) [Xenorhabdus nematophila]QNJ37629.1 arsenate reductase (glutaredoxin) [Xenorhabdus nematophila]